MRRLFNNIKHHKNWLAYLGYKYLTKRNRSFTFKHRCGMSFEIPARMMQTYKECFFDETYTKGLPSKLAARGFKTVVDVGANVGFFSLYTFTQNPDAKIFAFEPMPNNYKLLQHYQKEFKQLDFKTVNKAVGGTKGELTLNYNKNEAYTTSATIFAKETEPDTIVVETVTLQDILSNYNLEAVDFLKLDCEGAEYAILYNASDATLESIGAMSVETHPGTEENENLTALSQFLINHSFKVKSEKDQIWAWRS